MLEKQIFIIKKNLVNYLYNIYNEVNKIINFKFFNIIHNLYSNKENYIKIYEKYKSSTKI